MSEITQKISSSKFDINMSNGCREYNCEAPSANDAADWVLSLTNASTSAVSGHDALVNSDEFKRALTSLGMSYGFCFHANEIQEEAQNPPKKSADKQEETADEIAPEAEAQGAISGDESKSDKKIKRKSIMGKLFSGDKTPKEAKDSDASESSIEEPNAPEVSAVPKIKAKEKKTKLQKIVASASDAPAADGDESTSKNSNTSFGKRLSHMFSKKSSDKSATPLSPRDPLTENATAVATSTETVVADSVVPPPLKDVNVESTSKTALVA